MGTPCDPAPQCGVVRRRSKVWEGDSIENRTPEQGDHGDYTMSRQAQNPRKDS